MDSVFNITTWPSNDTSINTTIPSEFCRERHGEFLPDFYNLITCALCYTYVYADYNVSIDYGTMELVTGTNTAHPEGTRMSVDMNTTESISLVCNSLFEPSECWKWKYCCQQARLCCKEQLDKGPKPYQEYGKTLCPRTWDGYACWSDTFAGQSPKTRCPGYLEPAASGRYAYKTCTTNATWYLNPLNNKEWTDYTECNSLQHYQRVHKIALPCIIVAMFLVVPACIIFLYYRPLRQQHRIRLHICLMISLFLNSVSMLIWEVTVIKNMMETETIAENVAHRNSVGCRFLYVVTRYTEVTSFLWMFIEGFHLHRLLVHAFTVPKALVPYYVFGFGFPMLPLIAYSIIRSTNSQFNKRCWIKQADTFEWIIFAPSLLALVTNIFFLLRIVFIMVRQLEPHPNEPSNFRRAVKAVVVLVQLFGLQFLLFIYHPTNESMFYETAELLQKMSSSLQGAFIAITFCYLNTEVQGYLKISCLRLLRRSGRQEMSSRSYTATTQFMSELSRTRSSNGNADMMALRPMCNSQSGDEPITKECNAELINGNLHTIVENIDEDALLSPDTQMPP
ncbi:hypothetical protein BsWGS_01811 [Bradybaena similaris]